MVYVKALNGEYVNIEGWSFRITPGNRGYHLLAIDGGSNRIVEIKPFDTYEEAEAAAKELVLHMGTLVTL